MTRDIRQQLGVRPVIDVSGTMTSLGASIVGPEAVAAIATIPPEFVEIDDLQKRVSSAVPRLCGTEAGFVTASCSAGISVALAGAMTGSDPATIERLLDTDGLRNELLILVGHRASNEIISTPLEERRNRRADHAERWPD